MLPVIDLRREPDRFREAVARPDPVGAGALDSVRAILADVRARGDAALCDLTARFDGVELEPDELMATRAELAEAWDRLAPQLRTALRTAAGRIRAFQESRFEGVRPYRSGGVDVEERIVPVDRAGIYVPGGRAEYPSTVLMTVIPAQAAGVVDIVLCVPPGPDGRLPATTAAAAQLLGVDAVCKVGGAHAIAAMAYGTERIAPVDVIAGPGNIYVALAKLEVSRVVGVESFAGPSECVVVADADAPPDVVAVDLVAQAEHGPGGFALLVTWDDDLATAVGRETERLIDQSPRREEILSTFAYGGRVVICPDAIAAVDVANAAAPEHLQLMVADPDALLPLVRNAGAVFCGYGTPVTLGDYVAGPSHVLPTGGSARFASALSPRDFVKTVHVVRATADGLATLGPVAATLADAEGLPAHADAVRVRLRHEEEDEE